MVAAAATALPEVVGSAGVLVDPDDADSWAEVIDGLLVDEGLRTRLADAGLRHVEAYRPDAAATRLVDVWREVA